MLRPSLGGAVDSLTSLYPRLIILCNVHGPESTGGLLSPLESSGRIEQVVGSSVDVSQRCTWWSGLTDRDFHPGHQYHRSYLLVTYTTFNGEMKESTSTLPKRVFLVIFTVVPCFLREI